MGYKGSWAAHNCWIGGSYWATGSDVIRLPQWMVYWATYGQCQAGIIDGQVGNTTTSGFRCYQAMRGLRQDGVIGTNTWGKLSNDLYTEQCLGSPLQCSYRVGLSNKFGVIIRVSPSDPYQDDWFVCTAAIGWYSVFPWLDNGNTGRYAAACPGTNY